MKVEAKKKGWYGSRIREPGAVFTLTKKSDFSHNWMQACNPKEQPKPKKKVASKSNGRRTGGLPGQR